MLAGLLVAVDKGLIYALNPDMLVDNTSRILAISNYVIVAVFAFLMLQTGYMLFRGYVYSRYYAVMAMAICYTGVILRIFLFGVAPFKWKIIASIIFSGIHHTIPQPASIPCPL